MDTETHCEYYDTVRASYNLIEFLCSTPDTSLIIFCDKVNNFFFTFRRIIPDLGLGECGQVN